MYPGTADGVVEPESSRRRLPARSLYWLGAGLSALLVPLALLGAFTEFHLSLAASRLDSWRLVADPQVLRQAEIQLERARWMPLRRAEFALRKGQLRLFQGLVARDARAFDDAVVLLRASTGDRPTWPDGHLWFAIALARVGQTGEEFHHAIDQALTLGPSSGRLLGPISEHAAVLVPALTPEERTRILALAAVVGNFEARWTAQQLVRLGWLFDWCDRYAANERIEHECKRSGWQSEATGA